MVDERTLRFDAPPVVERVIGLQMEPIRGWTAAHAGIFARERLPSNDGWGNFSEHPPIGDAFERFDSFELWGVPSPAEILEAYRPRVWMENAAGDHLIQVQPSRFLLNWRRRSKAYPPYEALRDAFQTYYSALCSFISEQGMPLPALNQWEVSYIDHVRRGVDWDDPGDWHRLIPALAYPLRNRNALKLDAVVQKWQFQIPGKRGRVHVDVSSGYDREKNEELLILNLTARGPIQGESFLELLDLGHSSVMDAFLEFSSPEAHSIWGKR